MRCCAMWRYSGGCSTQMHAEDSNACVCLHNGYSLHRLQRCVTHLPAWLQRAESSWGRLCSCNADAAVMTGR